MKNNLGQEPAFPFEERYEGNYGPCRNHYFGMSKRFYAAIKLRVPDSGDEWLDEMIRKANMRDAACAAMQGLCVGGISEKWIEATVKRAYEIADELLRQENETNN